MANSFYSTRATATSVTSPKSNTEGKKVYMCVFMLSDIPSTMRRITPVKDSWPVAAQLMDRWFDNPAWEMSVEQKKDESGTLDIQRTPAQIDTTTVTMHWLMKFPRARMAGRMLLDGNSAPDGVPPWRNKDALDLILKRLRRDGRFTNQIERFGQGLSVPLLSHHCLLNERPTGTSLTEKIGDDLDDLYGALGAYTMRVAGAGYVEPLKDSNGKVTKHRIHLEKIGLFVRDTYEFIGTQGLGLWNFTEVKKGFGYLNPDVKIEQHCREVDEKDAEKIAQKEGEKLFDVENADFEAYRKKFGKGGDFVIYSDVQWQDVTHFWDI